MTNEKIDFSPLYRPIAFTEPEHVTFPFNWAGHTPFAFWIMEAVRPSTFVELGTHHGLSYCSFCQAVKTLKLETKCYAVDTWKGDPQAGFYGEEVLQTLSAVHDPRYGSFSRLLRETFDEAAAHFADGSIDLLHIDGYHTYDAVKHDFETWLPKVSKRGVVLFHDTNVREKDFGSWQHWEEVSSRYPGFNFLHSHGLGVLAVGAERAPSVEWLVRAAANDPHGAHETREFFGRLGKIVVSRAEEKATVQHLHGEIGRLQQHAVERDAELNRVSVALMSGKNEIFTLQEEMKRKEDEQKRLAEEIMARDLKLIQAREVAAAHEWEAKRLKKELITTLQSSQRTAEELRQSRDALRAVLESRSGVFQRPLRLMKKMFQTVPEGFTAVGGRVSVLRNVRFVDLVRGRRLISLIKKTGLFDKEYYQDQFPHLRETNENPLLYFLSSDPHSCGNPHPLFDTAYYLSTYPEVGESGLNPLVYFLQSGAFRGHSPSPLFNSLYYLGRYPDVAAAKVNPLSHYVMYGSKEGRQPHPLFDPLFYWKHHPELARRKVNPLVHYIKEGAYAGADPNPYFDSSFYLEENPEVAASRVNPLAHYITMGGMLDRDPSALFDRSYYLEQNTDVVAASLEPLEHFIQFGAAEGRMTNEQGEISYDDWISRFDELSMGDRGRIQTCIKELPRRPRISILLPLRNYGEDLFQMTLQSLLDQEYEHWELCVADASSPGSGVSAVLEKARAADPRIRAAYTRENDHIALPIRLAAGMANGEFVIALEPGDTLAPHALYLLADCIVVNPEADLIYADDDQLRADGGRSLPHFKPDWNEELLYSTNYIGNSVAVRRERFDSVGGFREGFPKSEVFDLVLRLSEQLESRQVMHIPHVLFHRKAGSDRIESVKAPMLRALEEHFRRLGIEASVDIHKDKFCRVVYPLPDPLPFVSIVIPTRDRVDLLKTCVESILEKTTYGHYEILVVDNDSVEEPTKRYLEQLSRNPRVRILSHHGHFNYSAINNAAALQAEGSLLCLMNNDTEVLSPEWLTSMVRYSARPEVGIVGAKLYYPDGKIQHAGVILGKNGLAGHAFAGRDKGDEGYFGRAAAAQELSAVTAACMLIQKKVFADAGGFDDKNLQIAFNDIDLCLRVRRLGLKVVFDPAAELYHHECATRGPSSADSARPQFEREWLFFSARWKSVIAGDPFYNPNLSLGEKDYLYAVPPLARKPWRSRSAHAAAEEGGRDPRLEPYAGESNLERSLAISDKKVRAFSHKDRTPGLSIVILNLNHPELIIPLLDSLRSAKRVLGESFPIQILVGDTGSTHPDVCDYYKRHAHEVTVEYGLRYQFSACNNSVFEKHAAYDRVLFLNNDVMFSNAAEALVLMAKTLTNDVRAGVVGTHLFYPDGRIQHAGIEFFRSGLLKGLCYHPLHGQTAETLPATGDSREVPAVTGACLMVRSALFVQAGGFDESYVTECQDVALCLLLRRLGARTKLVYAGNIIHLENATRPKGSEDWGDRRRFIRKWESFVEAVAW